MGKPVIPQLSQLVRENEMGLEDCSSRYGMVQCLWKRFDFFSLFHLRYTGKMP